MKNLKKILNLLMCLLLLCACEAKAEIDVEEATMIAPNVLLAHRDINSVTTEQGITIERVSEEKIIAEQKTIYTKSNDISGKELSWLAAEVDQGTPAKEITYYDVTYSSEGEVLSKSYVLGAEETVAATPRIIEFGTEMAVNTYFNPSFSRYGLDCVGCSGQYTKTGGNAIGIKLDGEKGVQQSDGTWKKGITYDGYYMVAADKSIPFCSIIEVTNHNYSGEGLNPNEPFYAIVVDRGSAIKNNRLDFYIGLEGNLNKNVKVVSKKTPVAKIVRLGGLYIKNGKYQCKYYKKS